MSIDRHTLLSDVATIVAGAAGDIATLRDDGNIRWEGPYDAPDPSGDPANATEMLDVILAEAGAGGDTFGIEMVEGWIELGVWIERKAGHDYRGRELCKSWQALFQNQDTSTMQFYPWEAYISHEGDLEPFHLKRFQLRYERRETIGDQAVATATQAVVNQVAHGLSALDWVGRSGGAYVAAGSDEAVGIVATVTSVDQFLLQTDGPLTAAHGFSDGVVYLHPTNDGEGTTTAPTPGQRYQRLGYAAGSTTLIVRVEPQEGA